MLDYSHGGLLKFKYKGPYFTIKMACEEWVDWESEQWEHALKPYLHVQKQNLKKSKISIFGEFLKFMQFNWFWADFENKWAYTAVWALLDTFQIVFSNFDCDYLLKYKEFEAWNDFSERYGETLQHAKGLHNMRAKYRKWEADQTPNDPIRALCNIRG